MDREFVIASGNPGKLREMAGIFKTLGIVVHPQSDWQVPVAKETASTFIENSLIKARQAARYTGMTCIADDSGLVVAALNGKPGIYSARYAGDDADDQANMLKLLADLQLKPGADRQAYFYCAMVLVNSVDDPSPLIATGRWHGLILDAPQGEGGFGYDPLFGVTGLTDQTRYRSAAELSDAEKCRLSHRGQALMELVRQLRERDDGFAE